MSNTNGQEDHPHVSSFDPTFLSTPARRRYRPASPLAEEEGLPRFSFQSTQVPSLLDIDVRNGVRVYPTLPTATSAATAPTTAPTAAAPTATAIMSAEEQMQQMIQLQANQQKQMEAANEFASRQAEQLLESQRQLQQAHEHLSRLTEAFESLSTQQREQQQQPRPLTLTTAPKKKPELPPFDSKNILVWIRRIEAAYLRVGVVEAKDKFAWLESMFQVKLNPTIDAFLYGTNTNDDWTNFLQYLKDEYGPTTKQKALKLMGETQRHDLKPSQFLQQLEEDTKDVKVDDIRKEHLLKTIPPRIREIMGKEVEKMSAKEVAKMADDFFDRQGKPLEKAVNPINQVSNTSSSHASPSANASSSSSSSSAFTSAFSDEEETDINFVKRNGGRGGFQQRGRSRSRPGFNRNPSNSSSSRQQQHNGSTPSHPEGTCRFHRRFGDKSRKCVTDCPQYKSFLAKQGNGQGGRRQ